MARRCPIAASVGIAVAVALLAFPGCAEAATFYVAPDGEGSACSASAPCGSLDEAYGRAAPGDVVSVAGGSYGSQVLKGDKGATTPVTVQVAAGQTARLDGSFDVRADFVRVVGPFVVSSGFNVDDSNQSNPILGVFAARIDAGPSLVENARDLVIRDSSFGGVDGRKPLQTGAWPTSERLTFDGVYFHDAAPTDAAQHLECLTISGVQGITVRNSVFRRCGFFGILAGNGTFAGGAPGVRDFVLENNVFERTLCWANSGGCPASGSEDSNPNTGPAPYSLMFGADPFTNVTIRNNAFQTEPSIDKPSYTNARFVGNVGAHGLCVSDLSYSHNVLSDARCGGGDKRAPRVLETFDDSWRLLAGSPAIGAGDSGDAPARDRGGQPRDADPDAGPDEFFKAGAPPRRVARFRVRLRVTRIGRRVTVRAYLSRAARISGRLGRRHDRRYRSLRNLNSRKVSAGTVALRLGKLKSGRYRIRIVARPTTGKKRIAALRFRVPARR
jgi:hypothetical protein